jgi:hypothetical protein
LNGCWECSDFPCDAGYFAYTNASRGQFIGCIKYINEVGLKRYVETVKENLDKGIKYGMGGDYGKKSEEEVMELLHKKIGGDK